MAETTRRLLGHDPATGITEWYHWDPTGGRDGKGESIIETVQDITGLVEQNKRLQNADTGRYGEMNRVASIPMTECVKLMERGLIDAGFRVLDQRRYRAWLNDPANRHFRTKLGKV